jgi:hypothetical protein
MPKQASPRLGGGCPAFSHAFAQKARSFYVFEKS